MHLLRGTVFQTPPLPLIGREQAPARAAELVQKAQLLTLIGPAGIGKSALAVESARRAAAGFSGGVFHCDLSQTENPAEVSVALAAALENAPGDTGPGDTRLGSTTGTHAAVAFGRQLAQLGQALWLLDGIDRVFDVIAAWLPGWLSQASQVHLLVTSRRRLRLQAEVTLRVNALDETASRALFLARARAARDGFVVEPEQNGDLATVLSVCDGVPLALALAAEQTVALSLRQLADRLHGDLSSLDRPLADMPAHHGSMHAALALSYAQLSPSAQRLLCRCSVLPGDLTLAAVEALAAHLSLEASLPTVLADLCDHSLLESERAGGPFRLGRLTRAFARAQLLADPIASAAAFAHHAALCLTAPGSCSAEDLEAIVSRWLEGGAAGVSAEHAARAACLLAERPSPSPSLLHWLDRVLELSGLPPELRARARIGRARLHRFFGRTREALRDLTAALRAAPTPALQAAALCERGHVQRHRGRPAAARAAYARALACVPEPPMRARVLASLGALHFEQGELEPAEQLHAQALELYRQCGEEAGAAVVFHNAGLIAQERGALESAEQVFTRALDLHARSGDRRFAAIARLDLAGLHIERGLYSAARAEASAALQQLTTLGDARHAALAQALRGVALAQLGQLAAAQADFEQAEAVRSQAGDDLFARVLSVHSGHLHLAGALRAYASGADADCASLLRRADDIGRHALPRNRSTDSARSLRSDELRLAHRLLSTAAQRHAQLADSLLVAADQAWLRGPGSGRADLSGKAVVRRLLAALLHQRLTRPELVLSTEALVRHAWPSERLATSTAANRLHVALNQLRKFGLQTALRRRGAGYQLDPAVPVFVIEQ